MKTALRKYLPRPVRAAAAACFYRAVDLADTLFGRSDVLVPPRSMIYVGGGDFTQIGNEFLGYFREFAEFRFPYPDGSFDLAVLTSVFTHVLPAEVNHYLAEIARVLRQGGRSFSTWFLLNDESRALVARGVAKLDFQYKFEDCQLVNPDIPGQTIGYEERRVREMHAANGLAIVSPLYLGSWCGRSTFTTFQDICVARKGLTGDSQ